MRRILWAFLSVALGLVGATSSLAAAETVMPLWRSPVVNHTQAETSTDKHETGRPDRWVSYVSEPTVTVYPVPDAKEPTPAVVVFPGGGFWYVCIDKEGIEPARWLNSIGITAIVVKYRTIDPNTPRSPQTVEPIYADALRAMRLVRQHATDWHIAPHRIGAMGFSAGAALAVKLTVAEAEPEKDRAMAAISYRPDFVICAYGGLPAELAKPLKPMPPFFIVHAADDPKVPVAMTAKLAAFVRENGGSVELHIFRHGDHGFGMQPNVGPVRVWPELCATWLRDLE